MDKQISDQSYDIVFVGQDYRPIKEAADRAQITYNGERYCIINDNEIVPESDQRNGTQETDQNKMPANRDVLADCQNSQAYEKILEEFLNRVTDKGKITKSTPFDVNMSETESKQRNKNKELYNIFKNELYFSGIVGVIKKQISVNLENGSEELEENDWDESEEENPQKKGKILTFNVTLQIKSRLDVADTKGTPGKPYFLSKMLLRDDIKFSDNNVPESEDELLDYLLLFRFRQQLREALQKGYYRTYRRFYRNDDKLKGSINVAEHIRLNMGRKNGKIAYTYRENTVSNYLNLLLVTAYEYLKRKYYDLVTDNFDGDIELKRAIDFLENEVQDLQTGISMVINKNLKPIAHPYFTEYEQLRMTCLKILRNEGVSIFEGNPEDENQSILFYLPDLWERYIEDKMLTQLPEKTECKPQEKIMNFGYRNENRVAAGEGKTDKVTYTYKQETYPDYVFCDTTSSDEWKRFMILDAKFKPKWENILEKGSISGVMEDYNKCLRDMCAINANATGVIFPTNKTFSLDDNADRILKHPVSEYNEDAFFYTIPVRVPLARDELRFSEWDEQFTSSVKKSKRAMNNILREEREFAQEIRELKQKIRDRRK